MGLVQIESSFKYFQHSEMRRLKTKSFLVPADRQYGKKCSQYGKKVVCKKVKRTRKRERIFRHYMVDNNVYVPNNIMLRISKNATY